MTGWFGSRGKLVRGLIIALALVFILLEWITRLLAGAIHLLIIRLGLTRFETWMRGLPLWCVGPLTLILAGLAHVLKWLILPILSYIWRLYDERLLRYSWIRWTYGMYMYAHELIVGWVHRQERYCSALGFKNRYVEAVLKYLAVARAAFGRWRTALHRRNTVFNAARRLKRFRFRRS